MAPQEVMSTLSTDNNKEESTNLWASILKDVQNHGNPKLPSCKQILLLGDNETGKTTLVAKLQGVEDPKKGSGLEYAYIDVRDDYRDDHTRLSVWVLDGDPGHTELLKFALNEETYEHTLVILTVTMMQPWGILEQLQHWGSVLADHLDKLKLDVDLRQSRRHHIVKTWQEYIEPGDELDPSSPMKRSSRNLGEPDDHDGEDSAPLPEGTLSNNLGLDIVVVVTKTDYMQTLEKDHDYKDEHLDFMQQWIRRFCLQFGAALFYTSAKEDKNCDLLYKYLTHKIYGFPFRTPALVVEKDAVFIPSGWDNMKKIAILHENLFTCQPDDYYREIIVQPATRKAVSRENELLAEDEQAFLTRQQQILLTGNNSQNISGRVGESPMRSSALSKTAARSPAAAGIQGSPKKLDSTKIVSTPGGEGVLANFFNSLLHKKTGTPSMNNSSLNSSTKSPGPESLTDKATMRSDAAAELDKLSRGKKPGGGGASGSGGVDFNASDC